MGLVLVKIDDVACCVTENDWYHKIIFGCHTVLIAIIPDGLGNYGDIGCVMLF